MKTVETVVSSGAWVAKKLRDIRLRNLVHALRSRAILGPLEFLHRKVIHEMRDLGINMEKWTHDVKTTTILAGNVCTSCRSLFKYFLELEEDELHCCLKIYRPGFSEKDDRVETWIRSEPYDGRKNDDDSQPYLVCNNSVWSALLGKYDGKFNWQEPQICFSCGDLPKHNSEFQNSRLNWQDYYYSTLVFPLNYIYYTNTGKKGYRTIGFLAFDSLNKDAFRGMPDVFDYRNDPTKRVEYRNLLKKKSVFHLGSTIADTLSMFLRPVYDEHLKKTAETEGRIK